ncbi:MAG: HEAT repeat domain-containing protein [Cyanobacteria bacterium J06597_1]
MQEAGAMWHRVAGAFTAAGIGFLVVLSPVMGQEPAEWQVEGVLAALQDRDETVWIHALDTLGDFELLPAQQQALVSDTRYQDIISFLADTQSDPLQASALRAIAVTGTASEPTTALKILPLLQDSDGDVRQAAIDALSQLQARSHLNQILPRLRDRDSVVQQAAIRAVGHLGNPQHASHLEPFLLAPPTTAAPQSPLGPVNAAPVDLRLATVQALADLGASNYSDDLVPFLLNSNPQLRQAASQALGQLNASDRIPDLLQLLEDPRWQARDAASQALGHLGATSTIPHNTALLNHPSWPVRQVAIHTLVRLDAREVSSTIARLLADPEAEVRAAAAEALGQLGNNTNSERLLLLLQDDAVVVRQAAIAAIGKLGNLQPNHSQPDNRSAIQAVTVLLGDRDSSVRKTTLRTLAQLNARETRPQIVELLRDRDAGVRQAAILALAKLEAHNALPHLLPLLEDTSAAVQQAAGEAVSQLLWGEPALEVTSTATVRADRPALAESDTKAISTILNLLHHRQWSIRQVGVQVLGRVEIPDRVPQILERLRDRHPEVRQTALTIWEQLAPHTVPTILQLLDGTYDLSHTDRAHLRFLAYYSSGGNPEVIATLQWLGKPSVSPTVATLYQRVQLLEQLYLLWPSTADAPDLRSDMAQLMAQLVSDGDWRSGWIQGREQRSLLARLDARLRQDGFASRADTIHAARSGLQLQQQLILLRRYLIGHAITWLMLWLLYPMCLPIQILVWHPWSRRILGHGYVGCLLTWVPILRIRLFTKWGVSKQVHEIGALACRKRFGGADLWPGDSNNKNERPHFDYRLHIASTVFPTCRIQKLLPSTKTAKITSKSLHSLKHWWCSRPVLLVHLPAEKCAEGVEAAIRAEVRQELPVVNLDPGFFSGLLHRGGMSICVEQLEFASAQTHRNIYLFAKKYRGVPIQVTLESGNIRNSSYCEQASEGKAPSVNVDKEQNNPRIFDKSRWHQVVEKSTQTDGTSLS